MQDSISEFSVSCYMLAPRRREMRLTKEKRVALHEYCKLLGRLLSITSLVPFLVELKVLPDL